MRKSRRRTGPAGRAVQGLICGGAIAAASPVWGQTADRGAVLVAARAGANYQGTESDSGTSVGGGGSAAIFVSPRWAVEFEVWIPAYVEGLVPTLRPEPGRFRDLLVGVSALRLFGRDGVRPYVLFGLAVSRTEYRARFEQWANAGTYGQAGTGILVPLSGRLAIAPEVRLNVGVFSGIVRPGVAVVYRLR